MATKHYAETVGTRLRGCALPLRPWARPTFSGVLMVGVVIDDNSTGVSVWRYRHR